VDVAQHRLSLALARVEAVLDVKKTIGAVERAIEQRNYAEAARHTYRVLHQRDNVQDTVSLEVMLGLEDKVWRILREECEAAQTAENLPKTMECARVRWCNCSHPLTVSSSAVSLGRPPFQRPGDLLPGDPAHDPASHDGGRTNGLRPCSPAFLPGPRLISPSPDQVSTSKCRAEFS
jgi:hypothetical protein